ncbi:phenylalanine--tRNA ligase subunit beta [Halovenus halobia]|uniref:phenylalanine--tRNA ligase subunit beta n=1 Tax=Halovenus halobia TaxID=3396622 RepID=UPI003F572A4E
MPVVDVDPDELRQLVGTDKDDDELREDMFALGLEFEGWTDEDEFQLEFAPDRLDRLSVEGIARSLRYQYGTDRGVYIPNTNNAEWTIEVDGPPAERPYVTGAVVRGLEFDERSLESLIQIQEKLHATMGRQRAKGAIGVHDLVALKGTAGAGGGKTIRYTSMDPDEERFVPLESEDGMTPREVTDSHHMGSQYADLVADFEEYPAIYDDIGLFSFPPVINGRRTEVSEDSRDLLIEMTGTDQWTVDHMCNIVCYALSARGGTVERVTVDYTDDTPGEYAGQTLDRPDFTVKTKTVAHDRIESIIGVEFDSGTVLDCLERAGLDGEFDEDDESYEVEIPPYRVDVIHPLDVIDDIGRAYGFNDLDPRYPDVSTVGGRHERSRLEDAARDTLVGLGFEDLLNFHMISAEENYDRLGVEAGTDVVGGGDPVTIREPYSEAYEILRTWALPSLLLVLENNTHREYPQHLSEIGLGAELDDSENTGVAEHQTVAGVLADTEASYEDARGRLQALAQAFDAELETPPTEHPTFISGRTAEVVLDGESAGVIGEIHPKVLVEHDLELPVAAFEFELDALE